MVQAVSIRLLLFGKNDTSAEEAVSNAISLAVPRYAIVDDVGVDRASPADLSGFDPVVALKQG